MAATHHVSIGRTRIVGPAQTGRHSHPSPVSHIGAAQQPLKVAMMIDDEPIDHMVFERVAKRSGLIETILSFSDGQSALDYLSDPENPPVDVVFLDVNMPRMNGFEFLETATRQLGPQFAKLCAMMLTTPLLPSDQTRAEQFAVVGEFINKPLKVAHIEQVAALVAGQGTAPTGQSGLN